ncbi:MAG: formate/nitrite transporter family protein [Oscillospiraceae bacterium]
MLKRYLTSGILAGICVGLGGSVFLGSDNRYVGAGLFSVGLIAICYLGYSLFTGRVGFIVAVHGREEISELLLCLLGNLIGACAMGFAIAYALPSRAEKALDMCTAKLQMPLGSVFVCALFCGILMYLAVVLFKEKQSVLGILFCVPAFILSGFEHSIADMFYFAVAGIVSLQAFVFIWLVILGNALGGMLMPALRLLMGGRKNA